MTLHKLIIYALMTSVLMAGCAQQEETVEEEEETYNSDMFTKRDMNNEVDLSDCEIVECLGTSISTDSKNVDFENGQITIGSEGYYAFEGELDGVQIVVDTDDNSKVQIVLNGLSMQNTGCSIFVKNADKVFVTTYKDSVNTITSTGEFSEQDGAIYSICDLTCNGLGSLTINSDSHGIVSKDDIVLAGGEYYIQTAKKGISGNDSIRIADGTYEIVSGTDGLQSDNEEADKGFIYIENGDLTINSSQDCMSSYNDIEIVNGTFNITSGSGAAVSSNQNENVFGGYDFQRFSTEDTMTHSTEEADTVSQKGIKSDSSIILSGGTFQFDCSDDAIHGGSDVQISGGDYTIQTGDDGIHSDSNLIIQSGTINITQSYEGLEGLCIQLDGGDINITSNDDGLNAAGGVDGSGFGTGQNPMDGDDSYVLTINDGTLVVNAGGDGIDSNGQIIFNGGNTIVYGPEDNGNTAIDYGTTAIMNGGSLVAFGSSGMVESFASSGQQAILSVSVGTGQAGSNIILLDSDGNVIVSETSLKTYDCVTISNSQIQQGQTYTLQTDTDSQQIQMDSNVYMNVSSSMGGNGPGSMDGRGGPGGM